jgi:hypothetical protein
LFSAARFALNEYAQSREQNLFRLGRFGQNPSPQFSQTQSTVFVRAFLNAVTWQSSEQNFLSFFATKFPPHSQQQSDAGICCFFRHMTEQKRAARPRSPRGNFVPQDSQTSSAIADVFGIRCS